MQLFVVGPPRSGMTIVTQFLNRHEDIQLFDEIDLLQVGDYGGKLVGALHAFLTERGAYQSYLDRARSTGDPAAALRATMTELAGPHRIWGEKNPRYATRLDALARSFPDAVPLFVLRDPREVVNSCLFHRNSPARNVVDFWIKDTVAEALDLVRSHLEVLSTATSAVLRYEDFIDDPVPALDAALGPRGLTFNDAAAAYLPPETAAKQQFFRDGAPLPWKLGNLSPLRRTPRRAARIAAEDPAWAEIDALARRFGYG